MANLSGRYGDSFLLNYQPSDLRIASEFLTTWLPFLSKDLCRSCTRALSDRVRSINPDYEANHISASSTPSTPTATELSSYSDHSDQHSLGRWKDEAEHINLPHTLGEYFMECPEVLDGSPTSSHAILPRPLQSSGGKMSWADMAQEDDELEDEREQSKLLPDESPSTSDSGRRVVSQPKPVLTREQREYLRFMIVKRKKDFMCLERVDGKIVNIMDGLELHTGIFSAVEQKKIVDNIYMLQGMGKKGELRSHTYSAPRKWMRGKGRITIQFGCCYNYAIDKDGNPPGILRDETVDRIPSLFKMMIKRLVTWHVLPPSGVPDSCIVNIYEEGDCIPPHIDNHDFVRPFCTVSFLSECRILFGTNLKCVAPGEFDGSAAISLPVGSVLVLNGNGADVAKHCVPAVPTKRISITFRKMDASKRPFDFALEPDLQGLKPLPYKVDCEEGRPNPQFSGNRRERTAEAPRVHGRGDYSGSRSWPGPRTKLNSRG